LKPKVNYSVEKKPLQNPILTRMKPVPPYFQDMQGVPLDVGPTTTTCRSSSERTTGKWVSHNAEHSRRMLAGGFRVTMDTLYLKLIAPTILPLSVKWSFPFRLSDQNCACIFFFPICATCLSIMVIKTSELKHEITEELNCYLSNMGEALSSTTTASCYVAFTVYI
jgi:hypothetical protein